MVVIVVMIVMTMVLAVFFLYVCKAVHHLSELCEVDFPVPVLVDLIDDIGPDLSGLFSIARHDFLEFFFTDSAAAVFVEEVKNYFQFGVVNLLVLIFSGY